MGITYWKAHALVQVYLSPYGTINGTAGTLGLIIYTALFAIRIYGTCYSVVNINIPNQILVCMYIYIYIYV